MNQLAKKSVKNPYIIGTVKGEAFFPRQDILSQLQNLLQADPIQSVLLYGHRRMGKSSILLNLGQQLGPKFKVAYNNLLNRGSTTQGVGEVLIAISDSIASTTGYPPPPDKDLLNLPYPTFERYIQHIDTHLEQDRLIIALDEFEQIEALILEQKISPDFLEFLRGILQQSPKVAFVFAGLHTLEEMHEDFFRPLFGSMVSVHVGFLDRGATHQLLANPVDGFSLSYSPEALDRIYALTAGQPYLVQHFGFQLVRRFNRQGSEYVDQSTIFDLPDIEAVLEDASLFHEGRYYFTGVWNQASQDAPGQHTILNILASFPEGLTLSDLGDQSHLPSEALELALQALLRHDVIQLNGGVWSIKVELFRYWMLKEIPIIV
jgi:hypothetical protein